MVAFFCVRQNRFHSVRQPALDGAWWALAAAWLEPRQRALRGRALSTAAGRRPWPDLSSRIRRRRSALGPKAEAPPRYRRDRSSVFRSRGANDRA